MPPINPEEIIDKIVPDTSDATKQLAKTDGGALFTMAVVVLIIAVGILIFTAFYFASPVENARKDQELRDRQAYTQMTNKYDMADVAQNHIIDSQSMQIRSLSDSISHMNFIQQFNASHGQKQIILTPKK